VIHLTRPVCVLAASVLHFLPPGDADALVEAVTATMVPGSYLAVSVGTATGTDPDLISRLRFACAGTTIVSARTEDQIMDWFTGLELQRPGLVEVRDWRPGHATLRNRWGPPPGSSPPSPANPHPSCERGHLTQETPKDPHQRRCKRTLSTWCAVREHVRRAV
jgi:O-methyltransferase involved in polyketide biosynthesis